MNFKISSVTKLALLSLISFSLTSCKKYGPVNLDLYFHQNIEMKTKSGYIEFSGGQQTRSTARINDKDLIFTFGGHEVVFKGTEYDNSRVLFSSSFEKSKQKTRNGERLGAWFSRTLQCSPECEQRTISEEIQSCTYYERRSYQRCWSDRYGRPVCQIEWEDYPVAGQQRVRVTRIYRNYTINGEISAERAGVIASADGRTTEVERFDEAISHCR